jgi:hypothetical protein
VEDVGRELKRNPSTMTHVGLLRLFALQGRYVRAMCRAVLTWAKKDQCRDPEGRGGLAARGLPPPAPAHRCGPVIADVHGTVARAIKVGVSGLAIESTNPIEIFSGGAGGPGGRSCPRARHAAAIVPFGRFPGACPDTGEESTCGLGLYGRLGGVGRSGGHPNWLPTIGCLAGLLGLTVAVLRFATSAFRADWRSVRDSAWNSVARQSRDVAPGGSWPDSCEGVLGIGHREPSTNT